MSTKRTAVAQVSWLISRLRVMTAREVFQRLATRLRLELWRRQQWTAPHPRVQAIIDSYHCPSGFVSDESTAVIARANDLLRGRYTALSCTFDLEHLDWNQDPQSGIKAPLRFGPLMDCKNPQVVGNVRTIWEINRHQHLTQAALAYALSHDTRFANFVGSQLESWLDQNPCPLGVNWASPLELGLRLISWVWIFRLLQGSPERELLFGENGRLWPDIYRQQWLIAHLRSTGSSANNHLIGEMAGLYIAATVWPVFPQSDDWSRLSRQSLHQEIVRQYYRSGVNREQSYGYHLFSTQLLTLAALEGERAERPFTDGYLQGLQRAVAAAAAQVAPGGIVPNYGDSDDGLAVGLVPCTVRSAGWLPWIVASWLSGQVVEAGDCPGSRLAADVLLGGIGNKRPPVAAPADSTHAHAFSVGTARTRTFPDAGLFIMASRYQAEDVICIADAGSLGYPRMAPHGHADALSFTLSIGDEPLIIDPGTFTYHVDRAAREYFRSTRAHNTVTIDGQDQSVAAGPFLWTRRALPTVLQWQPLPEGAILTASHDGYQRLDDPVMHQRTLIVDGGLLTIDDDLDGKSAHVIEWQLHLAPSCTVTLEEATCDIVGEHHRLTLHLDQSLHWSRHVGDSVGGWYSNSFNQRQKTTTLVGGATLSLPQHLHNVLQIGEKRDEDSPHHRCHRPGRRLSC